MREIIITNHDCGQRLDKYLSKYFSKAPKSFLYKMMRKKNITLNQKKCDGSEKLNAGDNIKMFLSEETFLLFGADTKPKKKAMQLVPDNLQIIYEDEHILFINKRAGELSQKAKDTDTSLVEQIVSHALQKGAITEESLKVCHPSVCNRLDRNTSGLITAGITLPGLSFLSEQLKSREVKKYYLCLVKGKVKSSSHLKAYLVKDEKRNQVIVKKKLEDIPAKLQSDAQWIETSYVPLCTNEELSLLKVHLITGRSHQIRAHLASIGYPIIGDAKYGNADTNHTYRSLGVRRQLLHAWCMEFAQIEGNFSYLSNQKFFAPLPNDFIKVMDAKNIRIQK